MLVFPVTVLLVLGARIPCAARGEEREITPEPQYYGLRRESTRPTTDACLLVTPPCVTEADRFSLEALRHIHREMDDDQDGCIEVEESVEFIIEDMQQQQQTNKHSKLHREDQHITIEELWKGWKASEVHNWTQEDVLLWLREFVELPQYEKNFRELHVNGNTLPRIASNEPSFMSTYLKVQDQQHKQKLKLKALDVVLFGPPTRPPHNWMKDLLLIVSVVMGLGGCWFAQVQNKAFKMHISKMMKDLDSLHRAEQSLRDLQEQLERAHEEKRTVAVEKQFLEERMRDEIQGAQEEANRLQHLRKGAASELCRLRYAEEELVQVRGALKKAEHDMQVSWAVPESLQLWLQLTHEVEVQYYNVKKQSAEQQLNTAKEEAEKIKKKRSSVLGTLHVAHSSSLDEVDRKILQAKTALAEVTTSLRERLHRWQQIEWLCGFPVMSNAGLSSLTATLYPDPNWMLLPRSAMNYPLAAGGDDLSEGMTPGIPQIPITVTPIKLSPRSLVRSRRAGHIVPSPVIVSPDPDLLIPIRSPLPRYGDEDGDHRMFPTLMKQECMESAVEGECIGRMYTGPGLDTPPRRLYREDVDLFSDSVTRKISRSEHEDTPSRKLSREEARESLRDSSRKVSREELTVETPSRKTSRQEPEASVEPLSSSTGSQEPNLAVDSRMVKRNLAIDINNSSLRLSNREMSDSLVEPNPGLRYREEADGSVSIQRRKVFREKKDLSGDSLSRVLPTDECETDIRRKVFREKKDLSGDSLSRMMLADECDTDIKSGNSGPYTEGETDFTLKTAGRDKADVPVEMPKGNLFKPEASIGDVSPFYRGKLFRGASMDGGTRKKTLDELDMETHRTMSFRERKDDGTSRKISRDQHSEMSKTSRDEFLPADPGHFSQPDLTISSLVIWAPPPDPLSQLVYDGILEKSYQSPLHASSPTSLSHAASLSSMSTSSQSLVGSESSMSRSPRHDNTSPPESLSGVKVKKTSKLKNLFKKKEKKDKDPSADHAQDSSQKL
ncbi:stromal interaction molecule 2 [Brachyhypopomus gauderio]|uniref:stromal interaction molecule 2 n=1 Tax=Brachyhypopomus gauderio TaxID=698409 RepID=UPI00404229AA